MYQGKTMLITGTSSTIGKEIVNCFANLGVNIIMTYYSNMKITKEFEDELKKKYNVNIDCCYLDLSDEKSVKELYKSVKDKYKKIDYLVNNAAISMDSYLFDKTKEEFMKVMEVNVVGTFLMMKYFDNIVDGYIFNMSSTDGINTGSIYSIDYNASKAAINMVTKTFALESNNIIISICPNWVDTESTREIDKNYLDSELKRIKQNELIGVKVIPEVIDKCIKKMTPTGSIIRIEGEEDVRGVN